MDFINFVELLAAMGTVVTVIITYRTARTASSAAKAAQEQVEIANKQFKFSMDPRLVPTGHRVDFSIPTAQSKNTTIKALKNTSNGIPIKVLNVGRGNAYSATFSLTLDNIDEMRDSGGFSTPVVFSDFLGLKYLIKVIKNSKREINQPNHELNVLNLGMNKQTGVRITNNYLISKSIKQIPVLRPGEVFEYILPEYAEILLIEMSFRLLNIDAPESDFYIPESRFIYPKLKLNIDYKQENTVGEYEMIRQQFEIVMDDAYYDNTSDKFNFDLIIPEVENN